MSIKFGIMRNFKIYARFLEFDICSLKDYIFIEKGVVTFKNTKKVMATILVIGNPFLSKTD